MYAEQVLDCQADLLARITSVPQFRDFLNYFVEAGQDDEGLLNDQDAKQNVSQMMGGLATATKMAECFNVTANMSEMVVHASELLDDTDLFMPDLAPSEFGFTHFDKPLPILDVRGRTMLANWLVWGKCMAQERGGGVPSPAVQVFWFNDHHTHPDEVAEDLFAAPEFANIAQYVGRWGLIGVDVFPMGREVGPPLVEAHDDFIERLHNDGIEATSFTNPMRHVHALWMLLGQTITRMREEDIPRHAMKRAQRAGLMPRVTVIELRRSEGTRNLEESPVQWTSQWLVRGHMRWQPYGASSTADHDHSLGPVEVDMGHSVRLCTTPGCGFHIKRIFISPYVKGPEGAPLRLKQHVYNLSR